MATSKITATVSDVALTITIKDGPTDLRSQVRSLVVTALCNQQTALTELKVEELP